MNYFGLRPIRWIWLFLAVVGMVFLIIGDKGARIDESGMLIESRLMLPGLIMLAVAFILGLLDVITARYYRNPS